MRMYIGPSLIVRVSQCDYIMFHNVLTFTSNKHMYDTCPEAMVKNLNFFVIVITKLFKIFLTHLSFCFRGLFPPKTLHLCFTEENNIHLG